MMDVGANYIQFPTIRKENVWWYFIWYVSVN